MLTEYTTEQAALTFLGNTGRRLIYAENRVKFLAADVEYPLAEYWQGNSLVGLLRIHGGISYKAAAASAYAISDATSIVFVEDDEHTDGDHLIITRVLHSADPYTTIYRFRVDAENNVRWFPDTAKTTDLSGAGLLRVTETVQLLTTAARLRGYNEQAKLPIKQVLAALPQ